VLGLVVALMSFTIESTSLLPDVENTAESTLISHSEDVDDERKDAVSFKVDHPATLSSLGQVTLIHEWRLILDVVLPNNTEEVSTYVVERFSSALFKTLFQSIISPNAP